MRKYREQFQIGQTRTVRKFLFKATQIGTEVRWLEFATIEQIYVPKASIFSSGWENIKFIFSQSKAIKLFS